MNFVRRIDVEAAGGEGRAFRVVDGVAEADEHFAGEDGHALGTRMRVRLDDRSGFQLETDREHAGRFRIAFEDGDLRARRHRRRRVFPDGRGDLDRASRPPGRLASWEAWRPRGLEACKAGGEDERDERVHPLIMQYECSPPWRAARSR